MNMVESLYFLWLVSHYWIIDAHCECSGQGNGGVMIERRVYLYTNAIHFYRIRPQTLSKPKPIITVDTVLMCVTDSQLLALLLKNNMPKNFLLVLGT